MGWRSCSIRGEAVTAAIEVDPVVAANELVCLRIDNCSMAVEDKGNLFI